MNYFVESLFKWIQTFKVSNIRLETTDQLLDGVVIAQILSTIAPDFFTSEWLSRLLTNVNADNWRLRVSNWRKILDKMLEYYDNVLMVPVGNCRPDVQLLGREGDFAQLGALLQLVLVIAVNSEQKQLYIENITGLDLNVQQNLMEAIQQLMMQQSSSDRRSSEAGILSTNHHQSQPFTSTTTNQNGQLFENLNGTESLTGGGGVGSYQRDVREQLLRTMENLRLANEKKEQLMKQNYELSRKLMMEQNEKAALQQEQERLQERLQSLLGNSEQNLLDRDDIVENDRQTLKLQQRIDQLERELLVSEQQREELLIKLELIERELLQLRLANEQLQRKVKETQHLQDELDVHRHSSDKVVKYEQKLETYKRKLEEFADMRKEWKTLEDKNRKLLATNVELEEELQRSHLLKQQIADYKRQLQELHQEILERNHRCDKLEFDLDRQRERFELQRQEKELLEKEKLELRSRLKEIEHKSNRINSDEVDSLSMTGEGNCLDLEMNEHSNQLRDKLLRLEHENKLLKNRLEQTNQEAVLLLRNSYQDAKSRCGELETENRKLNKKLIELESRINESNEISSSSNEPSNIRTKQLEDKLRAKNANVQTLNGQIYELEQRLTRLQGELSRKEDEFSEMDCKYKKYVHKAKQAVHMLEPLSSQLSSGILGPQPVGSNCLVSGNNRRISSNGGPVSAPAGSTCMKRSPLVQAEAFACGSSEAMRTALAEKDRKINELVVEMERVRNLSEMESRLITVAIHNIAFKLQHKAATQRVQVKNYILNGINSGEGDRLINGNSSSSNQNGSVQSTVNSQIASSPVAGHVSLLAKQRQATVRRNNLAL